MLGWKDKLSNDAVWQVLTYLRVESTCEDYAPDDIQTEAAPVRPKTQTTAESKTPFPGDPAALVLGRLAFRGQCAAECHPVEVGWKGIKYPNLLDCEWMHRGSDAEIFATVTQGVPQTEMLVFQGKLTDDVIWKIMAYLRAASQCKEAAPIPAAAH